MKTLRLALAVLALSPVALRADEIEDAINSALKLYKEGKLSEATTGLQNAVNLLGEKRGTSLSSALPDEIKGWKGGKIESASLAALGGGNTIERDYRKDEKKATVSIAADSPMLSQVSSFLSNPALGGLLGIKQKKVGDLTAMVHAKEGLLQMVVNNRFLVQIQGKKLTEEELADLAGGVKVEVLKTAK
jgi:hypothetical protein